MLWWCDNKSDWTWFDKKTDLFWRVAVNTFTFLCVYDMRIALLKWNSETLMTWLSEQFWRCCSCVYVHIEMSHARFSVCVCAKGKRASHKLYYQRMWAEHSVSRSVKEISCTTACHSTAALLQTGTSTSILTLHRHFLSARYLRGLSFSGEHER